MLCLVGAIFGFLAAKLFLTNPEIIRWMSTPGVNGKVVSTMPAQYSVMIRVAFIICGLLLGGLMGSIIFRNLVVITTEMRNMPAENIVGGTFGVICGLLITYLVSPIVLDIKYIGIPLLLALGLLLSYLGIILMMGIKSELGLLFHRGGSETAYEQVKILDTNIIIDGRIADICRTGFLEGEIYVPGFVLEELQHIADSGDSLKRARGRRGLDILNAMQKENQLTVRTHDELLVDEGIEEVDGKLVKLARAMGACIVTNDNNLNKVAELQGVRVLNVNQLANSLKPVVLPGEEMNVTIIREGKESSQGIGYLDDGTMIVVEGAKNHINETVPVAVTSVLQTVAGKMIFADIKSPGVEEEDTIDRNVRAYTSSRTRKKI